MKDEGFNIFMQGMLINSILILVISLVVAVVVKEENRAAVMLTIPSIACLVNGLMLLASRFIDKD